MSCWGDGRIARFETNGVVEETSTKERKAIIYTAQKSVGYLFL